MRSSRRILAAVCASTVFAISAPAASADEVDDLIRTMDELSQRANERNEEVKQLEVDIEHAEEEMEELDAQVQEATEAVEDATQVLAEYQGQVDQIAGAKYRRNLIDPLTKAMSGENPQNAIDRAAYLGTLTRNTEDVLASLLEAVGEADAARGEVSRASAEAKFHRIKLDEKRKELEEEQEDLRSRAEELIDQVEGLGPEGRARWEEKNGPVQYSLAGVIGTNPLGMAATEAAMSKLGAPYSWGAIGPSAFDCSGLVYWSYMQQGVVVPRTSQAQMAGGTPVSLEEAQPGDVVGYFAGATHVGIYAGNGMIVHASDYGIPVQVVPVDSMPIYGIRRY